MNKAILNGFFLSAALLCADSLNAHSTTEKNPHIVHRQGMHTVANGHMRALQSIIALGHPAAADIAYHANAIKAAFAHVVDAFPKGSEQGSTHANSRVWTQPEKFSQKQREADLAVEQLVQAADQNDQARIKQSFAGVAKACKNCHDDFRKKM